MAKKEKGEKEIELDSGKRGKTNWIQAEQDYVTGFALKDGSLYYPSLSEIADRYGVEKNTAAKHSMAKDWVKKREEYQDLIRKKAMEKKAVDYASEIVQFSKDMFHISKALKQVIMSKVFNTKKDPSGKIIMTGFNDSLNSLEMRRLAEVSIMVQTIQKNTVEDINTRKERTSIDDLVDIIKDIRSQYVEDSPEENEKSSDIDGELHPEDFIIEDDL